MDVVERDARQRVVDDGHDALVARMPGEIGKALLVDDVHGNARRRRALHEVAHARILAAAACIQRLHAAGMRAQPRRHGVETEQDARDGNGRLASLKAAVYPPAPSRCGCIAI
jgi:hypothetical protein